MDRSQFERRTHHTGLGVLTLGALGVVFGDIGTSPLYALRECFASHTGAVVNEATVLGVLSLIFWVLILVISIKYMFIILKADNKGEGGLLALTALASEGSLRSSKTAIFSVVGLGVFGAALLYGDAMIAPAISVLSAVEGIAVRSEGLESFVIPVTLVILTALFMTQRFGTGIIGRIFGPVMCIWFSVIGTLGLMAIAKNPEVLRAIDPRYAIDFLFTDWEVSFAVMGSVFLAVTGGESLYADMGHFGRSAIRLGWFVLAMPALLLNYFGQGALVLSNPEAVRSPFYLLAPEWAQVPMVILATTATAVASQAVIAGIFSITRQAVQLGFLPRTQVVHTSAGEIGQIFVPKANLFLWVSTVVLVLSFKSSSALAGAYGVAVSAIMMITTSMAGYIAWKRWKWNPLVIAALGIGFLAIEALFFSSNMTKLDEGGWVSLLIAALISTCMLTWKRGREILMQRLREKRMTLAQFIEQVREKRVYRTEGTAVFMTSDPNGLPVGLFQNFLLNHVVHQQVIIMNVQFEEIPFIPVQNRIQISNLGENFHFVTVHYGFMQTPNIPRIIEMCRFDGVPVNKDDVTYFFGRETIIATDRVGMQKWRERLFILMSRNSQTAMEFFKIPTDKVVEFGIQVEI